MTRKIYKINSIAWHQKNCANREQYVNSVKASLLIQQRELKYAEEKLAFHKRQIEEAIKQGKEKFDEEKFLKTKKQKHYITIYGELNIMPNWCQNILEVRGEKSEQERFKKEIKGDKSWLDFEKIISSQESRARTQKKWDLMSQSEKNEWIDFESYWFNVEGYEWNQKNWGTKWNIDCSKPEYQNNDLYYSFDTAWSPSLKITEALVQKYPNLDFKHTFEETGMCFAGVLDSFKGLIIKNESWEIDVAECPKCENTVIKRKDVKQYNCDDCFLEFNDNDLKKSY